MEKICCFCGTFIWDRTFYHNVLFYILLGKYNPEHFVICPVLMQQEIYFYQPETERQTFTIQKTVYVQGCLIRQNCEPNLKHFKEVQSE